MAAGRGTGRGAASAGPAPTRLRPVDLEALAEIDLLAEVMIDAAGSTGPVPAEHLDEVLGVAPAPRRSLDLRDPDGC